MHDDDQAPTAGWCVQVFLVADHQTAMTIVAALDVEVGGTTTALCVDRARWPVVVVETTDEPHLVDQVASLVRGIDPSAALSHRSTSQPWSIRPTSPRPADGLTHPA